MRNAGKKTGLDFIITALVAANIMTEVFQHFCLRTKYEIFPAWLLIKIMSDENFH